MEAREKAVIINAHTNDGWYPRGSKRLEESLRYYGWNWDIKRWDGWPNGNFDTSCPYNVKAAAWEEILKHDYTHVLWLDCSVFAVKNPNPIMDIINTEGWFFHRSGFNCAQTCSDRCLEYFGVTRDQAEKWNECSSSMFGLRLGNPIADEFIKRFLKAAKAGIFHGSREHDNQSQDPRFKFYRQDQSVASIILNQLGMKIYDPNIYTQLNAEQRGGRYLGEEVMFVMRGM